MEKDKVITTVADNVRQLMNEAELSINELARHSKISTATISRILNGRASITIPMAINLAEGLNVDVTILLKGLSTNNNKPKETEKEKPLSYSIGVLSINDKRVTCVKNQTGETIGTSQLNGGLDLAETAGSLTGLIQEAIIEAVQTEAIDHAILKNAKLNLVTQSYEFSETRHKFIQFAQKSFREVLLIPDWQITYLTAFNHSNGISVVLDKGVSFSYKHNGQLKKLGGWKFPVYDFGGGNWLGSKLIHHAIDAAEGYCQMTPLAQKLLSEYNDKIERITERCFKGADRDIFNEFSKVLLGEYYKKDSTAEAIVKEGFDLIYRSIEIIDKIVGQKMNITLSGSLVDIYKPFFDQKRLISSSSDLAKAELLASLSREYLIAHGIKDL
jgi:N-acetylglucosamine kinase-like BadF-type ATPase/plasmid maintenance system antidote protein VapI